MEVLVEEEGIFEMCSGRLCRYRENLRVFILQTSEVISIRKANSRIYYISAYILRTLD